MPTEPEDQTDFQLLAENSVDIICRAGLDYALKYVSPSCVRILGWSQEEMMRAPPLSLMLPEDPETAASPKPFYPSNHHRRLTSNLNTSPL